MTGMMTASIQSLGRLSLFGLAQEHKHVFSNEIQLSEVA
jgi:hypothetical protein